MGVVLLDVHKATEFDGGDLLAFDHLIDGVADYVERPCDLAAIKQDPEVLRVILVENVTLSDAFSRATMPRSMVKMWELDFPRSTNALMA